MPDNSCKDPVFRWLLDVGSMMVAAAIIIVLFFPGTVKGIHNWFHYIFGD